jgi:hypothetical protein
MWSGSPSNIVNLPQMDRHKIFEKTLVFAGKQANNIGQQIKTALECLSGKGNNKLKKWGAENDEDANSSSSGGQDGIGEGGCWARIG